MATYQNSTRHETDFSMKGFVVLSRLPFLSPGIAAIVTGILIAVAWGHDPDAGLVGLSVTGLVFIMLGTYYFNEFFDYEGDIINRTFIKFSGGSRAIPDKMVPRAVARIAGWSSVGVLVAIAVAYLIWYFDDYPLLLPLALFGAFCGIFYSHPPFQWSYQGIGEILIGGCYGILAIVSGYYIVSGVLEPKMVLISVPAALTIFGVIVANEFPDIEADRAVNKKNLVVRFGLRGGSKIFVVAMALAYPFMVASTIAGVSPWIIVVGAPVLLLSSFIIFMTLKGGAMRQADQVKISGATLLANLLSSLLFVPVVMLW